MYFYGSELALFTSNLLLCYYKDKWIRKRKRKYFIAAQKCANVFHFIGDLAANNGGEFEKVLHEIYPPELELKKENTWLFEASFFDLDINIGSLS